MKTELLVKTAFMTAVICILSIISVPAGEVPFSLGLLAIFINGTLLKPKNAFMSAFCYLLLGVIGLPVFAGFKGGFAVLFGLTGGFALSYPIMSFTVSYIIHISKKRNVPVMTGAMIIALLICYICGSLWFKLMAGCDFKYALAVSVCPFIIFDFIKIALAVFICKIPGISRYI